MPPCFRESQQDHKMRRLPNRLPIPQKKAHPVFSEQRHNIVNALCGEVSIFGSSVWVYTVARPCHQHTPTTQRLFISENMISYTSPQDRISHQALQVLDP
jgi:hypothetical protein